MVSNHTTFPHTLEHNEYAVRCHKRIVETILALLSYSKISTTFWPHEFATIAYLISRLPSPGLNNSSPYFKLSITKL